MIRKRIILDPITFSQDLSSAVLSKTTTISKDAKLLGVYLHFGATVSETVEVTKDMNAGANYDTVLKSEDLSTAADFVFRPTGEEILKEGDNIKVTCTKAAATCTVYGSIYFEEI